MSTIEYYTQKTMVVTANYKSILKEKINKVCSKIGFDDRKIKWIIFDPDEITGFDGRKIKWSIFDLDVIKSNDVFKLMRREYRNNDYGFCFPGKNEIWISTLSILKEYDASHFDKIFYPFIRRTKNEDFLANVLIDEITHIQTKCNHGEKNYEMKYQQNIQDYYGSTVNLVY